MLIGKTSPLTYNAVGHGKLVAILIGGFLIFGNPITINNIIGVFLTVWGLTWYTRITIEERKQATESLPVVETSNDDSSSNKV